MDRTDSAWSRGHRRRRRRRGWIPGFAGCEIYHRHDRASRWQSGNAVMSQPHDALGLKHRRASGVDDFASTYELFLTAANGLRARGHRDLLDDTVARRARALAFRAHAFS